MRASFLHLSGLLLLGIGSASSVALAQGSQTLPMGFDTVNGGSGTAYPQNSTSDHKWQWHYDNSNFSQPGPILITEISIRASSASATVNAFDFPSWVVTLAEASTDYQVANHNSTFANNILRSSVVRTGQFRGGPVPPSGGAASTWIPMGLTSSFLYDPTAGNDFIVQIEKCGTTATWGTSLDGSSGSVGMNLGNRYGSTSSCTATTHSFNNNEYVPIVKIDWVPAGPGFASAAPYGTGCYNLPPGYYEVFATGAFDLNPVAPATTNSILVIPTGGGGWVALPGSNTFYTPVSANLGLGDDQVSAAQPLPFTFNYVRGLSTTNIYISSNGFIYLEPSTASGCCTGSAATLLSGPARIAGNWHDLNPARGGSVHFDVDPTSGAAIATWLNVPEFGQTNQNTFQIALMPNGSYEIRWQNCANVTHQGLVGFHPGNGGADPGPTDISASVPFVVGNGAIPLGLRPLSRPVTGTTAMLQTDNIPAGSAGGFLVFGLGQINPGIDLGSLGAAGCSQYLTTDSAVFFGATGSTASHSLVLSSSLSSLSGTHFYAQSVALASGFNQLGIITSNGMDLMLGTQ